MIGKITEAVAILKPQPIANATSIFQAATVENNGLTAPENMNTDPCNLV